MKNFKSVIHRMILLMSILALTACGSNATSSENGSESPDKGKVYSLKFNIPYPDNKDPNNPRYYAMHWFKEEIEKRSEGRVKIELYFNGQLAQVPEMLDALSSGTIDIGYATASYYGDLVPEGFITYFPYWAKDVQEAYDLWNNTEIGDIYNKAFKEYGATPLLNTYAALGGWLVNKPVHSVEDMNGLLMVTMGGLYNSWYEELGINGVEIPHSDWYDALSRGIIDGIPTGFQALTIFKLNEVVKYVIDPPFVDAQMGNMFISNKTLEKLPKDLQDIIFEVSKEAELKALDATKKDKDKVLQDLKNYQKKNGIEVIKLSEEEQQKFVESVQPMWDKFASLSKGNAKIIEIIRNNIEERKKE